MSKFAYIGIVASTFFLLLAAGCSNSPTSPGTGELRMYLVDRPAQYDEVNIVVTRVDVHSAGSDSLSGWATINQDTATYDLLTLRNGANAILGDQMLPAGKYTQIRLSIGTGSNIVVDGVSYDLDVSAANTVKLNHEFDIEAGKLYQLTLDFDADHSIVETGNNQYKLDPVIRVVANVISGTISGIVSPALARATVSTIAGTDTVSADCDTATGAFMLMALPAGTYDVDIMPSDTAYRDTTIAGVAVIAQQDNNIGTVVLNRR